MKEINLDMCQTTIVHEGKVNDVRTQLQGKDFADLLVLSKCLGDASRVQLLYALATYKEMCVCDLAAVLNASMATTSHHLRFLKKNGLTDYCHYFVPSLPSFVPGFAIVCTTHCHQMYHIRKHPLSS